MSINYITRINMIIVRTGRFSSVMFTEYLIILPITCLLTAVIIIKLERIKKDWLVKYKYEGAYKVNDSKLKKRSKRVQLKKRKRNILKQKAKDKIQIIKDSKVGSAVMGQYEFLSAKFAVSGSKADKKRKRDILKQKAKKRIQIIKDSKVVYAVLDRYRTLFTRGGDLVYIGDDIINLSTEGFTEAKYRTECELGETVLGLFNTKSALSRVNTKALKDHIIDKFGRFIRDDKTLIVTKQALCYIAMQAKHLLMPLDFPLPEGINLYITSVAMTSNKIITASSFSVGVICLWGLISSIELLITRALPLGILIPIALTCTAGTGSFSYLTFKIGYSTLVAESSWITTVAILSGSIRHLINTNQVAGATDVEVIALDFRDLQSIAKGHEQIAAGNPALLDTTGTVTEICVAEQTYKVGPTTQRCRTLPYQHIDDLKYGENVVGVAQVVNLEHIRFDDELAVNPELWQQLSDNIEVNKYPAEYAPENESIRLNNAPRITSGEDHLNRVRVEVNRLEEVINWWE